MATLSSDQFPSETDPLLQENGETPLQAPTPIPWKKILVLCIFRLGDPIAFTQILPYINEMLQYLKVTDDPSRVGFYSGIVESAFSVADSFGIFPWARFARRKPLGLL